MVAFSLLWMLAVLHLLGSSGAQNTLTPLKEWEPCPLPGGDGICLPLHRCKVAAKAQERTGALPQGVGRCGFQGDVMVVCCPQSPEKAVKACNKYHLKARVQMVHFIANGEDAGEAEFPNMAVIGYWSRETRSYEWACGGTIIAKRYILTAAHCVNGPFGTPKVVRVGDRDLLSNEDNKFAANYPIAQSIVHPWYSATASYNDIALLRLKGGMVFNDHVYPACLHVGSTAQLRKVVVTGWGSTRDGLILVKAKHRILQKGTLDMVDVSECKESYNIAVPTVRDKVPRGLDKRTMLCAGDRTHKANFTDSCRGDSGGPMQYTRGDLQYIVGVTSLGWPCPSSHPGVYTKVSSFVDWISFHVWNKAQPGNSNSLG